MSFRNRIQQQKPARQVLNRADTSAMLRGRSSVVSGLDNFALANRLKPRRDELLQALTQIDTSVDQVAQAQIMQWIREEYEARQGGQVIGMFAKCYLGRLLSTTSSTCSGRSCSTSHPRRIRDIRIRRRADWFAADRMRSSRSIRTERLCRSCRTAQQCQCEKGMSMNREHGEMAR